MKTSNVDFFEKISKKPYPVPKEGLIIPKGELKQSTPKSYPLEQEVMSQE